jgi:hypothetical protein
VRRVVRSAVALLAAAVLLAGCAEDPPVSATETAGSDGRQIQVLVEQAALGALGADIRTFVATRPARISWGGGTADAISTTVKNGYRISVVVLPSGPALDRIRDELVAPPTRVGTLGPDTYWACPVDQFGSSLVRFLTSRTSKRVLRAHGFSVPT